MPSSPLQPADPRDLRGYRILARLGEGGQGVVYEALSSDGARVAVKWLHARSHSTERRLLAEIESIRRVAPFCTARVLDAGMADGRPYVVSELVEGVSLHALVLREGPRAGGSLDRLAVGTMTALAAIHRAGVVHRDFKPQNVLLDREGPRVIDFGIARLLDSTSTLGAQPVGTPAYLAPEQISGEPAGTPVDLFAWGLTMSFASSGRAAFAADSYPAVLGRILYGTPDLGELPGPLRELVVACLARSPEERPTAQEALAALLAGPAEPVAGLSRQSADPVTGGSRQGAAESVAVTGESWPEGGGSVAGGSWQGAVESGPRRMRRAEAEAAGPAQAGTLVSGEHRAHARPTPGRWRRTPAGWIAGAVALVAAATALAVAAPWRADPPALSGEWSGAAHHPSSKVTFPVRLSLPGEAGSGTMRWGEGHHCAGVLTRIDPATYDLSQVKGEGCHPGRVEFAVEDARGYTFQVIRAGEDAPRYTGSIQK
ncbi:serine/threonine-protein kinase [Nonomuraea sp. NPDC059194]|uniref:serine/threonine-protein kinase n=1 Tax=Nonomuraea sp. NPDC059194 TaxID=3346764 RepID=UPI0036BDF7A7